MSNEIDANAVISNLSNEISSLHRRLAVLQTQYDDLQGLNEKQQELIDAYKEKEESQESNKKDVPDDNKSATMNTKRGDNNGNENNRK